MTAVHVVVPDGIDDPAGPSGGNTYDRRICLGLNDIGWTVREHRAPGRWPHPDAGTRAALAGVIAEMPDHAVVLIDGLIASTIPELLVPEASRLRFVVLVHMPLGDGPSDHDLAETRTREQAALSAAVAVVTTSAWTRQWLLETYGLHPARVHEAAPGVDRAEPAPGTTTGGALLCVAAVTPAKGHRTLLAALAMTTDLPWQCRCVGSLTRDTAYVDDLRRQAVTGGIESRVDFAGPQVGRDLAEAYAAADVLVLASRAETYAMVVTEALARGLPVIATDVGGLPEALGHARGGARPGLLVPPDDPMALAAALRGWLSDADLRRRWRHAALERRATLTDWSTTSAHIARVLTEVSVA